MIQQFQQYALVRSVFYIITGIIVILYPQQFTKAVIYLVAAYIAVLGLMNLYSAFRIKKETGYYGFEMMLGILLLVAAAATLALAKPLLTILTIFLGTLIVLNGCLRIVQAFNLRDFKQSFWAWLIYGILLIIGGGMLMFHAISSIMLLFGSLLIFMGISELFGYFVIKRNLP